MKLCTTALRLPEVIDLASFRKFTALQTLVIHSLDAAPVYQPGNCFFLSTTLANLTSIILSNWPLLLKDGCSIATCLPSLLHASVFVHVDLVNAFTSIDQFKALYLVLMDSPPPCSSSMIIEVEKSSQLRKLVLCDPIHRYVNTVIELYVKKPGLQVCCHNLNLREIAVAPSDVYKSSAFEELAWYS